MRKKLPNSINLVESIHTPGDTFTIFYEWSFTVGKYLLIFIQIIVIAVFAVRLNVDRINNDLTEDINNQVDLLMQADIKINEAKYRRFQLLFDDLDKLEKEQEKNSRKIVSILDSMPEEIFLDSFTYNRDSVSSSFDANSLDDVRRYETFLKQRPDFSRVRLSLQKIGDERYEFSVNYVIESD